ncbi:AlbA family DNA-binding domain-containing protein [Sandaracinobacteroides hominis]|uniref:AlbA family DNA-binding domain-containing protein n=1 Tax=Sandaracinobacteroides hominis TaxID=2780086 RepID=UPI0018F4AA62|nr:ATP-binding protein [Sandaracinobacteroides hominis]
MKRECWTEADVLALSLEESDAFDRKSGRSLDKGGDLHFLSKILSAMANSGGGHIILGAEDDGELTGLPERWGRQLTKDWLENKIPDLLSYPLSNFRVHTVARAVDSKIPLDRVVCVIDVGDSQAAPHQARDGIYYHRVGGQSQPARHFYLELLRNRLTGPMLSVVGHLCDIERVEMRGDAAVISLRLHIKISNEGRAPAYHWRTLLYANLGGDTAIERSVQTLVPSGIEIGDRTILPGDARLSQIIIGLTLEGVKGRPIQVLHDFNNMVAPLSLKVRMATEVGITEDFELPYGSMLARDDFVDRVSEVMR